MPKLNDIVNFLDQYLESDKFDEWNGLQIEGKSEVKKIVFAVDASVDSFKEAIKNGADLVVVHHRLFGKTRIRLLLILTKRELIYCGSKG